MLSFQLVVNESSITHPMISGPVYSKFNMEIGLAAGVTGQQGMLTSPTLGFISATNSGKFRGGPGLPPLSLEIYYQMLK
jgi:hypothetical protein